MIPGRMVPPAVARIATTTDTHDTDACLSATSTPNVPAISTAMTSTSDTTHPQLQPSTTSSVVPPALTASEFEFLDWFRFPPSVYPSSGEAHKERSLEQSPAYASNYNDISTGGTVMPPPPEPYDRPIQSAFEADYSMRSMDYVYQANFYDYIKDESNVLIIARHLNRVIKDYKLRPVACGLRWLIGDWSNDSTVRLFRSIMKEWLPDVAGLLVDLIHNGAMNDSAVFQENDVGKLTAGLLKGESPAVSAVFVHSLTESWSLKSVSDLIADVDALLGWNETYFHQFTNSYIACVIHTTSIRSLGLGGPKRKSSRSIFSNRDSEATISSSTTDLNGESNEGNGSQREDEKGNEKIRNVGKAGEEESTGSQAEVQIGNLEGSQTAESGLGKSATLERLTSIYQTNLAVCNYRLALVNFKLALLENNIQCDLDRTYALNLAASRHSSFSGSTPNLHFGTKNEDDNESCNKKSFPKGHSISRFESLISLRWAMPPDESSPTISDRLDLTGSATSIRTLRGLDIASRENHEGIPLSTLSIMGQRMAHLGSPGRRLRRRVSCPGRIYHALWHIDPQEDGDEVGHEAPSFTIPSSDRGSRRSSQVSANSANEDRSTRSSLNSRASEPYSARRSSTRSPYAQSRRASLRRSIRPPPSNFLQPSTSGSIPKATAQDLTIQTLNSLSRPGPNLQTAEQSSSRSSIQPPVAPSSQSISTTRRSSSSIPAHRTASQRSSHYDYQTSSRVGGIATSRTSFSSSSSSYSSNSYNPSDTYNHWNPLGHPTYQYPPAYPSTAAAYGYPTQAQYDCNPPSLFSVQPDRHRPVHVPGLVPFPYNTDSATVNGEIQEKPPLSDVEIDLTNTNASRPVSTDRLEYRRGGGVPGDARRASGSASLPQVVVRR